MHFIIPEKITSNFRYYQQNKIQNFKYPCHGSSTTKFCNVQHCTTPRDYQIWAYISLAVLFSLLPETRLKSFMSDFSRFCPTKPM